MVKFATNVSRATWRPNLQTKQVVPKVGAFEWVQGILEKNQPEAAEADKVSVCCVRSPHDWLLSKDEFTREDVSDGHHEPPEPLVPLDPPEAGGCPITSQQDILLTVSTSHLGQMQL